MTILWRSSVPSDLVRNTGLNVRTSGRLTSKNNAIGNTKLICVFDIFRLIGMVQVQFVMKCQNE